MSGLKYIETLEKFPSGSVGVRGEDWKIPSVHA